MDTTLIKVGTTEIGVTDLLISVGLKTQFRDLIFNQATEKGMNSYAGREFTFYKLDMLKAYINKNKKDSNNIEELKPLIIEWLNKQEE